jgi:hypothetical protein
MSVVSLAIGALSWGTPTALVAQVFEVGGGTSSLYQAGGGSLTIHAPSYDFTVGAGTVNGHLLEGTRMLKATPHGTYIFGDDRIDFRLPTDVFDTSHYLLARGVGFSGVRHDFDILAFGGVSSLDYSSPFFNGVKMTDPEGVLFLKKRLSPRWQLYSDTIISKKITQIEALRWSPQPKTEVAFSAGIGANQGFGAVSLNMERPRFDIRAAYIAAGQQFHRITVSSPLLAEPDRENVLVTVRPFGFLTFSGSHQNYLVPQYPNPVNFRSSIDQGSVSLHFLGAQWNGTVYHSTYEQPLFGTESNHAVALSTTRELTARLHLTVNYFVSKPKGTNSTNTFLGTLSERLTSHIAVNQNLTYSSGHTSVNFGGEYISNFISFSANYDTYYVPAENAQPFQQALLLDLKMRLLGRLLLHGASFVDPTGHIRYTADANTVLSHDQAPASAAEHIALGRYILHGCVIDADGAAVEGAAVLIDEKPVYTDSTGCFYLRENKPHTHRLRVVFSEFLIGGNWQITSMPTTITSTTEDKSPEATVVVTVRKVREIAHTPAVPLPPSPGLVSPTQAGPVKDSPGQPTKATPGTEKPGSGESGAGQEGTRQQRTGQPGTDRPGSGQILM